jgi:hypothetical protein
MLDFAEVVSPLGASAFLKDYWLKQFVHIHGTPGRFSGLLTWSDLNAILEQHRLTPPRLKLYRDGQPVDPARYLTPAMFGVPRLDAGGLAVCLAEGASLILDDAQEVAPKLRGLIHSFQDVLRSDAFANLYAGWHHQNAFNRHWDPQEAVVIQLCGKKRWKVYQPTRPHPLKNDIEVPQRPDMVAWEGIVNDGDTLYIPRGWWHEAVPLNEPSLHLTISLTPPTGLDYLAWVISGLRRHAALRASLPPAGSQAGLAETIGSLVRDALSDGSLAEFQRQWEANIRPDPHIDLPAMPYDQLSALNEDSRFRLASLSRLSFSAHGDVFEFVAAGRLWTVPKVLQPALAQLRNSREIKMKELARTLPDRAAKDDLVKSLTVLARAGVVLARKDQGALR